VDKLIWGLCGAIRKRLAFGAASGRGEPDCQAILWVRSSPKYIASVRSLFRAVCGGAGLDADDIDEMTVAVGEALANAMEHGSPRGQEDYVTVSFALTGRGVTVCVSDSGGGLTFKRTKKPGEAPAERGYGLILIRALTSALNIRSNRSGTTITMEKRFPMKRLTAQ
jgi:anti-sigma regulatory factor (Ser/Thr protein kinase)